MVTMRLPCGDYCVDNPYAESPVVLHSCPTLAPLYGCTAGYPSLHSIVPLWLHVLDNALLYLSAAVLRIHDAADN